MLQPLKPFIDLTDPEGNSYTLELDEEHRRIGMDRILVLSGSLSLKNGSDVTVKIVRAMKWPFMGRHVRITGECINTPGEIAGQLNQLFAEE